MLCLFLLFRKCWRASAYRRLTNNVVFRVAVGFMCGFIQIFLILLCILLKFDVMAVLHVAYLVLAVALVGGTVDFTIWP